MASKARAAHIQKLGNWEWAIKKIAARMSVYADKLSTKVDALEIAVYRAEGAETIDRNRRGKPWSEAKRDRQEKTVAKLRAKARDFAEMADTAHEAAHAARTGVQGIEAAERTAR